MDILADISTELGNCASLFEAEQKILRWAMSLAQLAMKDFLEQLDNQIQATSDDGDRVINRQERTINFCFGPVTFKRRYYNQHKFKLDQRLKIQKLQRLSAYYSLLMAKVAQVTTMRNTAMVINLLFDSGVTVDSVMKAAHRLGPQVAAKSQQAEQEAEARRVPSNLTIEGDAFAIKIKGHAHQPARLMNVHHFRVYEMEDGQRTHCHDFLSLGNLAGLKDRVLNYLDVHYRCQGQTIFLGSDAGPGYSPESMLELVPVGAHGEYVVDRYHCLRKIENTLGHQNRLLGKAFHALRSYNWNDLTAVLDTFEAAGLSDKQFNNLQRLRAYLACNWSYISFPSDRGYSGVKHLGSVESSHRAFTYRMKKQGKSWSETGAQAMSGLIEARVNGTLQDSLEEVLKQETSLPSQLISDATKAISTDLRPYLRKSPIRRSCGAHPGRIALDAPSSSPIGHLAHFINE